ncbi:MAG: 3'-5' exoribonuclease, partial [Gemmatimonadales bacterium]|nr:3'-5' exoribonuclease [Gemmatimonadales bacterium]
REEAEWIVDDLGRDHARSSLGWGDYALLYRYHRVGQQLETRLVEAGIPCRTARGQALGEDNLIAYVVASLRVIRSPDDPIVADAFVELVLPKSLLFQVRTATSAPTLVDGLRAFAKAARRGDVDARRAWRVVYHLENLGALGRGHDSLARLVDELLAQRLGPFRSPLEERADELTDPLSLPAAVALAGRLGEAAGSGHTIWIEPDGGLEIALIRLIEGGAGGDVRRLPPDARVRPGDFILRAGLVRALTVFKALQLLHADGAADPFQDYVAFDLETTDLDVSGCDVVEIAAVRIRGRVVVDRFESRVRPTRPLHPEASAVHGWYDQDLCDQPLFADVWPEFRAFVGKDVLVAHNGQRFDIPVLRRLAAGLPGADDLAFFDTLPLARSLVDGSARLADLADRFGVSAGRSHHALDDAVTLAGVLAHLGDLKLARARKGALVHLIGWLGLALALVPAEGLSPEERLLRDLALPATLGRFSDCLEIYAAESPAAVAPAVEEIVERLGGARLMERIRTDRPVAERYPASVARLSALVDGSAATTLDDSIDTLLDRVALSKSDGVPSDPGRVSLLTLHSTKGLEFSRVYVVGVEDGQLPGLRELDDDRIEEIRESRRLLYVGMTRAKDRLVLTSVERREGRGTGGALFLREAGLEAGPAPVLDESAAPLAVSEAASA